LKSWQLADFGEKIGGVGDGKRGGKRHHFCGFFFYNEEGNGNGATIFRFLKESIEGFEGCFECFRFTFPEKIEIFYGKLCKGFFIKRQEFTDVGIGLIAFSFFVEYFGKNELVFFDEGGELLIIGGEDATVEG